MPMENKSVSEHRRKLRLSTVAIIGLHVLLTVIALAGGAFTLIYGFTHRPEATLRNVIVGLGCTLMGGFYAYVVSTFLRRMWAVKVIRPRTQGEIEIITWNRQSFTAKLPQDLWYTLQDKGFLTIGLRVGRNKFVIDSLQFSDSQQLSDYFRRLLTDSRPPGPALKSS